MQQDFNKIKLAIKYRLFGRADQNPEWYLALKAYEFGRRYHTGMRKDGVTPEYQHQIEQANLLATVDSTVIYRVETMATVFLHDVVEDYTVSLSEIRTRFGDRVASAVEKMTNKFETGQKKDPDVYYQAMIDCPIASICKGLDRAHNIQTMVGVHSLEKQKRYLAEMREHILPMMAAARRNFPEQERVYENIKHLLLTNGENLDLFHGSVDEE